MVEILSLGDNQDYYRLNTNKKNLRVIFPKSCLEKGYLLNDLKESSRISANQLKVYGATVILKEMTTARDESVIDGLERFFRKVEDYATKHNAPFVLIQELEIQKSRTPDIKGLVQLLIKD